MTVEPEFEDLARELHATRAQPRPEYARELDARAAAWLSERPRRRLPSLRIALPAAAVAATAAVVVALALSGGDGGGGGEDRLEVAVVAAQAPSADGGAEALDAPTERESMPAADVLALEADRAPLGALFIVRYAIAERTEVSIELAGRDAAITLEPGVGSIEISTEGLPAGAHRLRMSMRGVTALSERVEIDG